MSESSDMTVVELKALCAEILEKRAVADQFKEIYKEAFDVVDKLEDRMLAALEKIGETSFKALGMNFIRTEKESLAIPQGDNKHEFFNYLKSVSQFEALASVNSATLNAWYKQENAAAKERGEPYAAIPGLEIPAIRVGLTIRKA